MLVKHWTMLYHFLVVALIMNKTVDAQCDPCRECGTFEPHQLHSAGYTCEAHLDKFYDELNLLDANGLECSLTQTDFCLSGCCSDFKCFSQELNAAVCLLDNIECAKSCESLEQPDALSGELTCDDVSGYCALLECCPACADQVRVNLECQLMGSECDTECPSISYNPTPVTTLQSILPTASQSDEVASPPKVYGDPTNPCFDVGQETMKCFGEFKDECKEKCANNEREPIGDCNPLTDDTCLNAICDLVSCCPPCDMKFKAFFNCELSVRGLQRGCSLEDHTQPTNSPSRLHISPQTSSKPSNTSPTDSNPIPSTAPSTAPPTNRPINPTAQPASTSAASSPSSTTSRRPSAGLAPTVSIGLVFGMIFVGLHAMC